MTIHTITSNQGSGLSISTNGDIWSVQENVAISNNAGIAINVIGNENRIAIDGLLSSSSGGLALDGTDNKVLVGDSAQITGDISAVVVTGANNQLQNTGILATSKNSVNTIHLVGDNVDFRNDGAILTTGGTSARSLAISGDDAIIANSGTITSTGLGIRSVADNVALENSGKIDTTKEGIYSEGHNFNLVNLGTIQSDTWAINATGGDVSLRNAEGASIDGAIFIGIDSGNASRIENMGTISAGLILGGDGNDTVINSGNIAGIIDLKEGNDTILAKGGTWSGDSIDLGAGNDLIDMRGGTFTASMSPFVFGGKGNDTYILDGANAPIAENLNEGVDTIKTAASFNLGNVDNIENVILLGRRDVSAVGDSGDNVIAGNRGNNVITGMGGEDTIDGGQGNDTLRFDPDSSFGVLVANLQTGNVFGTDGLKSTVTNVENMIGTQFGDTLIGSDGKNRIAGGEGDDILTGMGAGDTFVFSKNFGADVITDFGGKDRIDMSKGAQLFSDFDDLLDHAKQSGGDTIITLGTNSITLVGIDKADLGAHDFLF